jgi:hypothetical protein
MGSIKSMLRPDWGKGFEDGIGEPAGAEVAERLGEVGGHAFGRQDAAPNSGLTST